MMLTKRLIRIGSGWARNLRRNSLSLRREKVHWFVWSPEPAAVAALESIANLTNRSLEEIIREAVDQFVEKP